VAEYNEDWVKHMQEQMSQMSQSGLNDSVPPSPTGLQLPEEYSPATPQGDDLDANASAGSSALPPKGDGDAAEEELDALTKRLPWTGDGDDLPFSAGAAAPSNPDQTPGPSAATPGLDTAVAPEST
jgi:hypothetical protein